MLATMLVLQGHVRQEELALFEIHCRRLVKHTHLHHSLFTESIMLPLSSYPKSLFGLSLTSKGYLKISGYLK